MRTIQLNDEMVKRLEKFYNIPEYYDDTEEDAIIQEICKLVFEND